jgi:hypothetical protein
LQLNHPPPQQVRKCFFLLYQIKRLESPQFAAIRTRAWA